MSKTRYVNFAEWYKDSGAQGTVEDIQTALQCTRAAALQILILMDLKGLFGSDACEECGRPFDDDKDHDGPLFG